MLPLLTDNITFKTNQFMIAANSEYAGEMGNLERYFFNF